MIIAIDDHNNNRPTTTILFNQALLKARDAFHRNITKDINFRIKQLEQLKRCLNENQEEIVKALDADFRKPRMETIISEIDFVTKDIEYQLKHIREYIKPRYVEKKGVATLLDNCHVKHEPYGVVLIFSAWNYPVQLLLSPLVGAITAGNCAIIKPSEVASNCEKLMAELLPRYLDRECFHVITGGPEEATRMLNERFDMVFFTGSTSIGKMVYNSASKFLTPVVLELGGKSPVYMDDSINMEIAVRRLLWGKCMNSGQICIAPDYLLCTKEVKEKFINIANKVLKDFFEGDAKKSESFARIINDKNFDRLQNLINSTNGKIVIGGDTDKETRYISPTIVTDVISSDSLMKEEIFGPILPIITIDSVEEAIEFIKRGEKPLTMYLFTNKKQVYQKFINETSSGSVAVNETILQMTVDEMPFGGVGPSGIGNYHGRFSFEAFSHKKSVMIKDYNPIIELIASCRYPPYNESKLKKLRMLVGRTFIDDVNFGKLFGYLMTFLFGAIAAITVFILNDKFL
ncbi:aldehyde dehydrogenase 3, member A2, variant 3 [Dermatophagoides farinae]|uniref:Aldehyde dehydrogenase n=1 Tax=Dermatophagoides farinae TaxID=6954 RepID=A0A922L8H0_DERFA|nr:aldehyde dehydrogenase 3, member A2, variant 3 [Dermatophagoides farinae]